MELSLNFRSESSTSICMNYSTLAPDPRLQQLEFDEEAIESGRALYH